MSQLHVLLDNLSIDGPVFTAYPADYWCSDNYEKLIAQLLDNQVATRRLVKIFQRAASTMGITLVIRPWVIGQSHYSIRNAYLLAR